MGATGETKAHAVVEFMRSDERYRSACAALADVLGVPAEAIEALALEEPFIFACSRLSAVKRDLAVEWNRTLSRSEDDG